MVAVPASVVPAGEREAGSLTRAQVTGRTGWFPLLGALASGLAVAVLLLALIVMHAGVAPATAAHSDMTAGGGMSAVTMAAGPSVDGTALVANPAAARPAGAKLAAGLAVPALAALALPGDAGPGGMPGHAGGAMCLAVLTMVALSLAAPFLRELRRRGPARAGERAGEPPSPAVHADRARDHPPWPSAALTRLCVLRT